ncbi:uncharacterized protein B4U80_07696 [Leptotrombidium deliense]|uniref:Helitron helicase-like domain-containing protein n=1 Tax=Leptotrombidium deliense TaxID=299467 RepID=A0A443RXR5_9ACAR|nr:uncharacterized protein B4U80_07696 [Leptotrombidium deliense]
MNIQCEKCKGLSFNNEQGRSKNSCCHGGKVILENLNPFPQELEDLLNRKTALSNDYLQNIRIYNNAFAFASFNAKNEDIAGRGPYCMRIRGQPYKMATTSLYAASNPRYGQIYIYDDNETINFRQNSKLNNEILLYLQTVLRNNPYADSYRYFHEVCKEKGDNSVSLNFVSYATDDKRPYNVPTTNNIAAVITTCDGSVPYSIGVKVYPRNEQECDYLSNLSHHSDPMLFPLLFPHGEGGCSHAMKTENMKNILPLQYYSFMAASLNNI